MKTPSAPRIALLAGATGATGTALLPLLLADARYSEVRVLTRRPLALQHPRLRSLPLGDDGRLPAEGLAVDDVFCCLGTTLKKAGSRAAFERVDYHLVLDIARATKAQGARQFLVVSAAGSAARSPSFYARVKARMEQAVADVGFESLHILRPSLLLAARHELRPGEWLGQQLAPLLNPLLRGPLTIYRAVAVADVAAALLALAQREQAGVHTHHLPLAG